LLVIFEFDGFEIDDAMFELRVHGRLIRLQPKAFDLLLFLVKNRSRTVTTGELFATLWPNETVGSTSLAKAVYGARQALRDGGLRRSPIRTVWRRGYHFAISVRETPARASALPRAGTKGTGALATESPAIRVHDGLAVAERGDLFLVVWKAPANADRIHWMFDEAEQLLARCPRGILSFVVVLPSSAPPDFSTAIELVRRQLRLGGRVRRQANVALGGRLWLKIVKSALQAMQFPVRLRIGPMTISSTIAEGIVRVLEVRGPMTPSENEIQSDVAAMFAALRVHREKRDKKAQAASVFFK
jgi:DNA-binding winged helix-turn-helix (wHTH) protein